jgi:hypothetical protein
MDAEQVIESIANHLDLSSTEILADETLLERFLEFVNDALDDLTRHGDWEFLRTTGTATTVATEDTAALPSDFARLIEDSNPYYAASGNLPLVAIGHREIERRRAAAGESGRPRAYRLMSGVDGDTGIPLWYLDLYPTADAEYEIVVPYRRRIERLAANYDILTLPPDFDGALKLGAKCEAEEGWERVAQSALRPKYEAAKARLWAEYNSPVRDQRIGRLRPWRNTGARGLCCGFPDERLITVIPPGG